VGSEIQKTRSCVVISPSEMHGHLRTDIVAQITTGSRGAGFHVPITFQGTQGLNLLDKIRMLDKSRPRKHSGQVSPANLSQATTMLRRVFKNPAA